MNRRSFLGLLAGATFVNRARVKGIPATDYARIFGEPVDRNAHALIEQDYWMPFTVTDWATLQPGQIVDAAMFSGEQPDEFMLNGLDCQLSTSATVADCLKILGDFDDETASYGVVLELKSGRWSVVEGPLYFFGTCAGLPMYRCPMPYPFLSAEPLSLRLRSAQALDINAAVNVYVCLQGSVRMNPAQVARCRAAWEAEDSGLAPARSRASTDVAAT